ncbi:nuclear transport factor 2 family protein [Streptomyces blattellae]|uniref:nuclear transport factor 2 family protein n=1 Tax=Streptomyces blattellae TaxID=2569855 RepID=UPI0018ACAEF8|nr:nuclear transport factor 2 family protein [Streptomyces blattellae]
MTTSDGFGQLPADLRPRFSAFLDRAEVTELVLRFHAHLDRWDWDALPSMVTSDCSLATHIDGVPAFVNWDQGQNTGLTKKTNWREESGIKGQHQWTNVVVILDGDTANVMMSGTQTNSWPDGGVEISGAMGEGTCRRTPDGWRIAGFIGNYRSNFARLRSYFTTEVAPRGDATA